MSKSDVFENDWMKLVFNAIAIANLADNASVSPLTNLYLSLHTADPGEAGSQTTSECAYGGYARQPVARSSSGFTVSTNQAVNAAQVQWPQCVSGSETITHFGVGTLVSGAGKLLYSGARTGGGLAVSTGIQPTAAAGAIVFSED
jgi:hypothetical protein